MLNIGMLSMRHAEDAIIIEAVIAFVHNYGLVGFMSALPTTSQFVDYESVYLPKNYFIKEESLSTQDYLEYFFPFEKLDFRKKRKDSVWNIDGDNSMMSLAITFADQPQAMNMSFQREYAERYDWLVTQFKDMAFTFYSSFLYYQDYNKIDETTRNLYRQGMAAFGGIAPSYHIELLEHPVIVWEFHSLLRCMQMMFSFTLTDEKNPLRSCKHCTKAFVAGHPNALFCSPQCKNQHNVYKSRKKQKESEK